MTFRIGITQAPSATGLNPYLAVKASDYYLISDMYDQLTELSPNLDAAPGLAESWDISEDGLSWTFHLRPGVSWQDGTPFTAEDVRFQLQYIFDSHDPAYKGPQAPDGNDLTDGDGKPNPDGEADHPLSLFDSYLDLDAGFENTRIKSITAPDDCHRRHHHLGADGDPRQSPVPHPGKAHLGGHHLRGCLAVSALTPEQAIGTGPFQIESFDPNQVVVLRCQQGLLGWPTPRGQARLPGVRQ